MAAPRMYREYARRESAGPPAPMNLCCSAVVEVIDRPACGKQLQCRTVPAARQTPCALGKVMRRSCSEKETSDINLYRFVANLQS
jgi:hypothetical protein